MKTYRSVVDKWLHFDKNFTHKGICTALGIEEDKYILYLNKPWDYFTVSQMEKLAYLLEKDLPEVFWACYKKPYSEAAYDEKLLKTIQALERAGIK